MRNFTEVFITNYTAFHRTVNGHELLFIPDSGYYGLAIYRFDRKENGSIAIPCGLFAGRRSHEAHALPFSDSEFPPGRPSDKVGWLWIDRDGDGKMEEGEYLGDPSDEGGLVPTHGYHIDSKGGIWRRKRDRSNSFDYFPPPEFSEEGVPLYSFDKKRGEMRSFKEPKPFDSKEAAQHVERILYDADADVLILSGGTESQIVVGGHERIGPVLARYDAWSKGNRTPCWTAQLSKKPPPPKPYIDCPGWAMAGDFLFIGRGGDDGVNIQIYVHDLKSGDLLGIVTPHEEDVGRFGFLDMSTSLTAIERKNGEILLFAEDVWQGRSLVFRFNPGETKSAANQKRPRFHPFRKLRLRRR